MKKSLMASLLLIVIVLSSCGGPIENFRTDEFQISCWRNWRIVQVKKENAGDENVVCAVIRTSGSTEVGVRVVFSYESKVTWGRIREMTQDYVSKAVSQHKDMTIVSDKYVKTPNAQGEERYEIIFSIIESGEPYTLIQHLYAIDAKVYYVTAKYPEGDPGLENDINKILDSFMLAPQKGWPKE